MPVRPSRDRGCNTAPVVESPSVYVVILARPVGDDAAQLLLRDEIVCTPERVRRFAVEMLSGGEHRYGLPLDAQVFTRDGAMLFACQAGGAS